MAETQEEVKPDDETPGEKEDQFEDAQATPKPESTDSEDVPATDATNAESKEEHDRPTGLGITNGEATETKESTVEVSDDANAGAEKSPPAVMSARLSLSGGDDMAHVQGHDGADSFKGDGKEHETATAGPGQTLPQLEPVPVSEAEQPSAPKTPPDTSKMKRLSLLEEPSHLAPRTSGHERTRSRSPARFPVRMPDATASKPTSPDPVGLTSETATSPDQKGTSTGRTQSTSPPPAPSGLFARKASSGFGAFLARATSIRKPAKSPTPRPDNRLTRRDTGTSVASVDSSAGGVTSIAEESEDPKRPTLQDQFRSLRRQQEETHGDAEEDGDNEKTPIAKRQSDAGVSDPASPTRTRRDSESWLRRSGSTPNALMSPPLNNALPPGTALGMSAGPAREAEPVNWDLWQRVVYEGPAAVTRSSGEELNHAIGTGIPPAIRGVVWQVLAESKDENLEGLYRTLKTRGSGEEQAQRPNVSRTDTMNSTNGNVNEKESGASSRSSVHSGSSTPATSNMASPPASVDGNATEVQVKLLAEKQKREAAALTKLERAIKRDLGSRTSYSKYTQSAGLQDGLFGVCKAFALFDETVGYAQGINFVAMPLLFNMNEEEAFSLLVRLMHKYDLRSLFTADMPGLHMRLYQFERLLEDFEPALYCHLRRRNVQPQLYATQWFLTLFAYRFPLQLVLRVYDLVFSQGLTAVLKFGIALMQRNRDTLLSLRDMSQLTTFLKEKIFDVYIDKAPSATSLLDSGFFGSVTGGADKELYHAEEMVRDACNIPISDETLNQYSAEWEESQRLEREREAEMENLRSANISLTAHVRALEERVQQHDAEHVNIAGDLVRTKVENDRLQDENEGLQVKMEELQKMVDLQPAEVEGRLREEMERIMQRNLEVQNENRSIKEEMDEMEHELVNAKVGNAQLQAEHETLRQKWSNIQTLLNDRS